MANTSRDRTERASGIPQRTQSLTHGGQAVVGESYEVSASSSSGEPVALAAKALEAQAQSAPAGPAKIESIEVGEVVAHA
jgi:hypothetical protein